MIVVTVSHGFKQNPDAERLVGSMAVCLVVLSTSPLQGQAWRWSAPAGQGKGMPLPGRRPLATELGQGSVRCKAASHASLAT